ncbi:MAG TPA: GtrA family protein [Marmoricola sp.]|nr:GtrA family protein [Marmoricola sp.]
MTAGLRRLSGEVARFSAVNVAATVVAVFLFNALVHGLTGWFDGPLNEHAITAYLLANSVGMFVSYFGSRHYAFRHRHAAGPGGGFARYVAINLASFVIPVTCLWVTRHLLHWESIYADNISGNVVGALLGNAFRFWAFRRFVFHIVPVTPRPFWTSRRLRGKHEPAQASVDEDGLREVDVDP